VRLLLDSHILLRLDSNPSLVPAYPARRDCGSCERGFRERSDGVGVGHQTEKQKKGKLVLSKPVSAQRLLLGFLELPITIAHAEHAAGLPLLHGDPFDRMLVAQAIVEQMVLVTADSRLAEYPVTTL
jgi:hypothetical protein